MVTKLILILWRLPFDSLAPERSGFNFKSAISNLVLLIGIFRSSYDNALIWMSWELPEDKSTLFQVMDWCSQATNHYLSQCWPRSKPPYGVTRPQWVYTLRPRQNGHHLVDNIFAFIFLNENAWILNNISLKLFLMGPINNIPVLVQIMAWCWPSNKPWSEPMMVSLLTHICITWYQWVNNSIQFNFAGSEKSVIQGSSLPYSMAKPPSHVPLLNSRPVLERYSNGSISPGHHTGILAWPK